MIRLKIFQEAQADRRVDTGQRMNYGVSNFFVAVANRRRITGQNLKNERREKPEKRNDELEEIFCGFNEIFVFLSP
jgi:hypothetical protein